MTHVDHGWRHAPKADGGTDPIPGMTAAAASSDMPWAIINTTSSETIPSNSSMTFAFTSRHFNTNDTSTFSIRSGAPSFQGIEFLRTGVYEVWYFVEATKSSATSPETWVLTIGPGAQGSQNYPNEFDLTDSRVYGITTPGTSQGQWKLHAGYLIGIADVSDQPSVTVGVQNHVATAITSGGNARIYAKRLSDPLADFSNFF